MSGMSGVCELRLQITVATRNMILCKHIIRRYGYNLTAFCFTVKKKTSVFNVHVESQDQTFLYFNLL